MRVLVTGASGFIGARVIARLVQDGGFEIIACSRRPGAPAAGVTYEPADLLVPGEASALVGRTRPSHLLHLAWNATPGKFWTSVDNLDWAAASLSLMRAFIEAGGHRMVMAGTGAEYDWTGDGHLFEDSAIGPVTLYGSAKDAVRRAVCAAGEQFNVSVGWGRVFWLYGPGEARGRLVSDVARALAEGHPVNVGEGWQRRDFSHVDDVAAAFVSALKSGWHGPFNIGSGIDVAVREVVGQLADAAGRPDLVYWGSKPTLANEPPLLVADIGVLRRQIGFNPSVPLRKGLKDSYCWWATRVGRGL